MKPARNDLDCQTDYFSACREEHVITFSLKSNFLLRSTIIKAKDAIFDYFRCVSRHPEIRVVVLLAKTRKARREEYLTFFDMLSSSRLSINDVMRMYRAFDQFMLHIIASDLFFISADCGQIIPMFANLSLACDHRIIGANAVFQNPALEIGLVSKGGGAWFLPRMLGRSKAFELLLAKRDISAQDALTLGLADRCVPAQDLQEEALKTAREFAGLPPTSLQLAKRLINYSTRQLADYLEFENEELLKGMRRKVDAHGRRSHEGG